MQERRRRFYIWVAVIVLFIVTVYLVVGVSWPKLREAIDYYAIKKNNPQSDEYSGQKLNISFKEVYGENGDYYTANINMTDMNCIKTELYRGEFFKYRIGDPLEMAENANAVLAINGDNAAYDSKGLVIRGSRLYSTGDTEGKVLLMYHDGSFEIVNGENVSDEETANELVKNGVTNSFSGGFALIEDGVVADATADWKDKKAYTCIGMIDKGSYFVIVSNSDSNGSTGLTKDELAKLMSKAGCTEAYILESGTECIMIYKDEIKNNLCGRKKQRSINDIIYFAE